MLGSESGSGPASALQVALSLVRIPRLFASLLLFPLMLAIALVGVQLFGTAVVLETMRQGREQAASKSTDINETAAAQNSITRQLLYGTSQPLPAIKVCRWEIREKGGKKVETYPSDDCAPERLDVAFRSDRAATEDVTKLSQAFNGATYRLHVCGSCKPDVIIGRRQGELHSVARSIWGLLVLHLARFNEPIRQQFIAAMQNKLAIEEVLGDTYFMAPGYRNEARLTGSEGMLALLFNVAGLVVVALWLALKAHRRVLDYFARNGALLPMVAATGQKGFYGAIWLITAARVVVFILAAVPATIITFLSIGESHEVGSFVDGNGLYLMLWVLTIALSFSLATLIASIADLKQRHSILSFLYTYLPLILGVLGGLVWAVSFFFEAQLVVAVRTVLAALPIAGMTPVLLAPLFQPAAWVLIVHCLISVLIIARIAGSNARWFAAHLEEL